MAVELEEFPMQSMARNRNVDSINRRAFLAMRSSGSSSHVWLLATTDLKRCAFSGTGSSLDVVPGGVPRRREFSKTVRIELEAFSWQGEEIGRLFIVPHLLVMNGHVFHRTTEDIQQ